MYDILNLPAWAELTPHWKAIAGHYGNRVAERSSIPLINHIIEGVNVLEALGASRLTSQAFMLHPLIQDQVAFDQHMHSLMYNHSFSRPTLVLVLEYRRAANAYLCKPHTDSWGLDAIEAQVGPLRVGDALREMLIADKWQNQKDFRARHLGTHPRSDQLEAYFKNWQELLDPHGNIWPFLNLRYGVSST